MRTLAVDLCEGLRFRKAWNPYSLMEHIQPQPCGKCSGCFRSEGQRYHEVLSESLPHMVAMAALAAGLSVDDYCRRHGRVLTVTVATEAFAAAMKARAAGYRLLCYSVSLFEGEMTRLAQHLARGPVDRWRRGAGPGQAAAVTQVEPQGKTAGHRLHGHIFLMGVPNDEMVWDGADRKSGRYRSLEAWLTQADRKTPANKEMRWLLKSGFWGLSECSRLRNLDALLTYISKELTTSDVDKAVPDGAALDAMYQGPVRARRIRRMRGSRGTLRPGGLLGKQPYADVGVIELGEYVAAAEWTDAARARYEETRVTEGDRMRACRDGLAKADDVKAWQWMHYAYLVRVVNREHKRVKAKHAKLLRKAAWMGFEAEAFLAGVFEYHYARLTAKRRYAREYAAVAGIPVMLLQEPLMIRAEVVAAGYTAHEFDVYVKHGPADYWRLWEAGDDVDD